MGTLTANTCWPSRFLARWLAVFFAAVIFGAILAALLRKKPDIPLAKDFKEHVVVRVSYRGSSSKMTAARVYLDAGSKSEMRENDAFAVGAHGDTEKRLAPGSREFMVQPMEDNRPLGEPVHFSKVWPSRDGETVSFDIVRDYAEPGHETNNVLTPPVIHHPPVDHHNTPPPVHPVSGNNYDWLSTRTVTDADLAGKSAEELHLMRNWIFAKHGHKFHDAKLSAFFEKQPWYHPTDTEGEPTALEKQNVDRILKAEGSAGVH